MSADDYAAYRRLVTGMNQRTCEELEAYKVVRAREAEERALRRGSQQ